MTDANQDYVYGKNPVIEVLRSGQTVHKVWIAEDSMKGQMNQVLGLCKKMNVQVQTVPRKRLDQMADGIAHQGVIAQAAAYEYAEIDDLFARAKERGEDPFFLVLDELEDPHNLGSILRTADASGAHGVIIPKRRSVGLTSTVAKTSAGAIAHVPVARVTNLARTMDELKKQGLWFVGTDAKGDVSYEGMTVDLPLALVIGSEGKGMSRLVKEKCDFLVSIPLMGKVTSLNASVAASLLMYEVLRKRRELGMGADA
ncbi:23S rRNA (guanosine(2251)-2'-O)-methyltransferase RlmB [Salisediminibacterium selenitireducens]|uniref:RNA methyltransferase, TrmH family, group 3 n=1 Tax=Bacillus selenitireducens (strain ATCC 700615 / DSM 15326 / MLS10) TaxID=439292 RepID=D6XV84_BACIE|nr:23S rRNA (guanosine(2251)-2'-O)-methyltransferase RlmB [Salisediminibacterium selenitireducens]ADH97642.1 RNA methyltransferase, TrmH family, group 3 [[Bacillus] selenitireducens MLS10]